MNDLPDFPSRRGFLKTTALGLALTGAGLPAAARETAPPVPLDEYQREYLTEAEWAFVMAATARLIPSEGDGPGAIEARVPVFIDRQLAGDYGSADDWYMQGPHDASAEPARGWQTPLSPAEVYRRAIPAFDAWCETTYGTVFSALDPAHQDAALAALQEGEPGLEAELRDFFAILLANTKEGYFADPLYGGNHGMQSWVYIGFPGARAAYREWPERHNIEYPLGPVSISGEGPEHGTSGTEERRRHRRPRLDRIDRRDRAGARGARHCRAGARP
ncbi:gluconate 2-dehydrogenase subunit 3 family protein [Mangrovicoccus ximenensis]|uniref:gluconate 2-dehydrogenase subunit 3 family protein n=1 Tax=Mangrovicoccus ximenensis TaxID=1911570 RepID=UPI001F2D6E49|nr:gluconate 2-dehydrogenase subunit 3 family protein [Mangrovicoccus ximenensis]